MLEGIMRPLIRSFNDEQEELAMLQCGSILASLDLRQSRGTRDEEGLFPVLAEAGIARLFSNGRAYPTTRREIRYLTICEPGFAPASTEPGGAITLIVLLTGSLTRWNLLHQSRG